jgi:hypothetical protein
MQAPPERKGHADGDGISKLQRRYGPVPQRIDQSLSRIALIPDESMPILDLLARRDNASACRGSAVSFRLTSE